MGDLTTRASTGQAKVRRLSFLQYFLRWLYRVVFVFLGTTIVATIVQAIVTLQGANLTLSSIQQFFIIKLAIQYPLPFLLGSCVFLLLGIGGFVTDRILIETEKARQTEGVKKAIKEGLAEIFDYAAVGSLLDNGSKLEHKDSGTSSLQLSWWGEVPSIPGFVGRRQVLEGLINWVVSDDCQVVAVLGFGGIGKTSLVAKFAEEFKDKFEFIYWRSMQNAPSFRTTLLSILQLVSSQQYIDLPEDEDEQIALLIGYLKAHRCLVVLDNWDTLLREGDHGGQYQSGFEVYGELMQKLAEVSHRSCFIITSREKPRDFAALEVNNGKVQALEVKGLEVSEALLTLAEAELKGSPEDWDSLVQLYAGNPLYLKLVAGPIQELFGGQIRSFLETGERVFGSLQDPVELQFGRLSTLEQGIMYWLAIEREATSLDDLCRDLAGLTTKREVLAVLEALRRRSMIETNSLQQFALQPVILEYTTTQFVEKVVAEIASEAPVLFAKHALIKARAKDYVRNSQVQLLLTPIAEQLLDRFGKRGLEKKLKDILATLHDGADQYSTYTAGNILNLLIQARSDLRGYDFSHLTLRQVYLQGVAVPEINFAFSHLEESVFTDTFGGILSLARHPDGTLLAAGTTTGEIRLWQLPEGRPLKSFQGHTDWVMSVAFTPDGTHLVSGSEDLTLRIWDVGSGQCLRVMHGHENWVRCIAIHPNGTMIASAGEEGATKVWDMTSGECLVTLSEQTTSVWSVAFSPDGKLLANSSGESTLRLWDVATWEPLYTLEGHTGRVWCVTFSPDGRYLASSSQDQTIRLWDVESRTCLHTFTGHTDQIWSVTFSFEGAVMVSTSEDQTVRLWHTGTFELLRTFQGHTDRVWSSVFTQDGKSILTASQDQTIRFWDLTSGQHLATLRGYTNPVNAVAFHPSNLLLGAGTSEQAIHIWDIKAIQLQHVLRGHTRAIRAIAFSPNGRLLASGSDDHTICLWNAQTGACLEVLEGHDNWVESVAFHPTGSLLASGSLDKTVRIWEIQPEYGTRCIQVLRECRHAVWSVAFSPDGTRLAGGSGDTIARIWDTANWHCLQELQEHKTRVSSVAFSPTGASLATGSNDHSVCLWDTATGLMISTFHGHTQPVWAVAFSPDGAMLATGGGDRTVHLWQVETQQGLAELQGHTGVIQSIQFSPDSQLLASSSEDGTVRLWNLSTNECVAVLSSARPYERMDITGVYGITPVERSALQTLGAIEYPTDEHN